MHCVIKIVSKNTKEFVLFWTHVRAKQRKIEAAFPTSQFKPSFWDFNILFMDYRTITK